MQLSLAILLFLFSLPAFAAARTTVCGTLTRSGDQTVIDSIETTDGVSVSLLYDIPGDSPEIVASLLLSVKRLMAPGKSYCVTGLYHDLEDRPYLSAISEARPGL